MDAMAEAMGPREFSRLLEEQFQLQMSHQAVSKASYLPKHGGKVLVQDALLVLAERGRITLQGEPMPDVTPQDGAREGPDQPGLPLAVPDGPKNGRPLQGGTLAQEQTLTERVKRRKLELEVEEKEGRLLRVEDVTEAMVTAARRIGDRIDQMQALADELNAASKSGGASAIRDLLRREIRKVREHLADAMTLAADEEGDAEE